MSARNAPLALLAASLAALLSPAAASADAWLPQPGEYYSEFRASYGIMDRFFDSEGTRHEFFGGGIQESRELVSYNEVGWKKNRSIVISIPASSVTYRRDSPAFSGNATGLSDLLLGARFRMLDGPTALSVETSWKAPLGYERDATPSLGNGQQDLLGGIHFGTEIEALSGFVELSWTYRYRFEAPPDEMTHAADLGFWLGPSLLVEGKYRGVYSVGAAEFPFEDFDYHVFGPRLTYRLDDRLDVFAGSSHLLWGSNVSQTHQYYVGMAVKQTRLNRLQGFLGGKRRP